MKWFRSNVRHGARLALFALLVQFALSFGHSHWFAQATPLLQASLQQADGQSSDATANRAVLDRQSPASPDRDQGDDNCAICAVVSMAGTIVFATPPLLLLPQAVTFLYLTTDAEFAHLQAIGTAFQARAPPLS
ncbi:DUF2946 domain-containing protein [Bradyrhizobium guangdongense]|uniref:DUF2946 domain-containing protein n=1 Tax=Bradyrhizobium guangdongense TaxID=1325090 RepID=UPI00112E1247|nr:DUF2946 domain-containing protein [Bradyrhizobium guangdongense]TPQ39917.1 DUF2946 domain-containing protein [Bradyrhizobium guangdongense]